MSNNDSSTTFTWWYNLPSKLVFFPSYTSIPLLCLFRSASILRRIISVPLAFPLSLSISVSKDTVKISSLSFLNFFSDVLKEDDGAHLKPLQTGRCHKKFNKVGVDIALNPSANFSSSLGSADGARTTCTS